MTGSLHGARLGSSIRGRNMAVVSSDVGFAASGFDTTFLQSLWEARSSALDSVMWTPRLRN